MKFLKAKKTLSFINKNQHKLNYKKFIPFYIILSILLFASVLLFKDYNNLINNFESEFESNNFGNANNIAITQKNYNPIKLLLFKNTISNYFSNKIDNISSNLENSQISSNEALNTLYEVDRYNLVDKDKITALINKLSYDGTYNYGVSLFNDGKFTESFNVLSAIRYSDPTYQDASDYINKCKESIKTTALDNASTLCKDNYYTKALDSLQAVTPILGNDQDIISKIEEIKNKRDTFIAMQKSSSDTSEASSLSNINNISSSNINQLSISSNTKYLIHVDLANQKTNIYSGKINNWLLVKSFVCSTGVDDEETPTGIYTVKDKGEWFFSEKYNQGGKYWVQFSDNYLFHSLPYDKTKTNIVDPTLGKPSSHGCVRLSEEDSKWLYDNVTRDSKVIIK